MSIREASRGVPTRARAEPSGDSAFRPRNSSRLTGRSRVTRPRGDPAIVSPEASSSLLDSAGRMTSNAIDHPRSASRASGEAHSARRPAPTHRRSCATRSRPWARLEEADARFQDGVPHRSLEDFQAARFEWPCPELRFCHTHADGSRIGALVSGTLADGWYVPGTLRPAMARRFQALIVATASVRSASSFSLKWARTLS